MAELEETAAVPLRALPAGLLVARLLLRTLPGAPAGQGGGGPHHRGLHPSGQQSLSLSLNVECLFFFFFALRKNRVESDEV